MIGIRNVDRWWCLNTRFIAQVLFDSESNVLKIWLFWVNWSIHGWNEWIRNTWSFRKINNDTMKYKFWPFQWKIKTIEVTLRCYINMSESNGIADYYHAIFQVWLCISFQKKRMDGGNHNTKIQNMPVLWCILYSYFLVYVLSSHFSAFWMFVLLLRIFFWKCIFSRPLAPRCKNQSSAPSNTYTKNETTVFLETRLK